LTPKVVSNASPLIYAAKISFLEALQKLYEKILIPPAVYNEVVEKGTKKKAADALIIEEAVTKGHLQVVELNQKAKTEIEVLTKLHDISVGEAQAIALAKQVKAKLLIIDERSGTMAARVWGIKPIGLLGIIIEAMYQNVITFEELKTYFKRLTETEFRLKHGDYMKAMELARKVWRKLIKNNPYPYQSELER
jgi:predicted nucleic acid-binding protein